MYANNLLYLKRVETVENKVTFPLLQVIINELFYFGILVQVHSQTREFETNNVQNLYVSKYINICAVSNPPIGAPLNQITGNDNAPPSKTRCKISIAILNGSTRILPII